MIEDAEAVLVTTLKIEGDNNNEEYDCEEEVHDWDLRTPLMNAAVAGDFMTARSLLEGGADTNETTKCGHSALWFAFSKGHSEIVRLIIEKNEEDNNEEYEYEEEIQDWGLRTPLMNAAVAGDFMTARSLLEGGADTNETTNCGHSALWFAASKGHLEIVRLLAEEEKVTAIDDGSPLRIACSNGHLTVARNRCDQGALQIASHFGHLPVVRYLVEKGADMEETDEDNYTSLNDACSSGHYEVARYLLEQGADRDTADARGCTPLHNAADFGEVEIAKLLMVYGADLNAKANNGQLPIDRAYSDEIKQAIRDEPRRRMDEAPGKRATEQDRHPNVATSASAQQDEEDEQSNKKQRLDDGTEAEEGKVAEEDEDSEPSDDDEEVD
jgi:ankyrin repeat protein